jgi:hypothetical protein
VPSAAQSRKPKRKAKKPKLKKVVKKPKQHKILVRTSERTTYNRCAKLWDWNYNERLKPIQESPALRFGTLIHAALEERYPKGKRRGPHPARAFEKIYEADLKQNEKEWGTFADDAWVDAQAMGIYMLEGYVEKYGKDEEWEVIESEMNFQVPVFFPDDPALIERGVRCKLPSAVLEGKVPFFWYTGTMDGVWKNRQDNRIRVNDYKTCKGDAIKEGQGKLKLDEQGTAYWTWGVDWLINETILKPRSLQALDGMLYTFLRKATPDDRDQDADGYYLNNDGSISKKQPSPRFHRELVYRSNSEREKARQRACEQVMDMCEIRAGIKQAYKSPETGSNGHCGWCPQRDVCELHEAGAPGVDTLIETTMTTWDPYDAHEIKWAENK